MNLTAYLSVFKPSSFYILISTSFGIKLMVQLSPIMQVFVSADPLLNGTTAGTSSYCANLICNCHYCVIFKSTQKQTTLHVLSDITLALAHNFSR